MDDRSIDDSTVATEFLLKNCTDIAYSGIDRFEEVSGKDTSNLNYFKMREEEQQLYRIIRNFQNQNEARCYQLQQQHNTDSKDSKQPGGGLNNGRWTLYNAVNSIAVDCEMYRYF